MNININSTPFVGLRSFESDESILFFGRHEEVLEILDRLYKSHFVFVIGGSGIGKSSLIKAGVIPNIKAGRLIPNRDRWIINTIRPGSTPLYNLVNSIQQISTDLPENISTSALVDQIQETGAKVIIDIIRSIFSDNQTNYFLFVDQFEEIFHYSSGSKDDKIKDEIVEFVDILLKLSKTNLPIYVIVNMRSDFIGDTTNFFGLSEFINKSFYLLPPLSRYKMREIIQGPIKLFRSTIDPMLTDRLLNDTVQFHSNHLPMLQYALMRMWNSKLNTDIPSRFQLDDYQRIGGIENALSIHGNEILSIMNEKQRGLTKKIFQSLIYSDELGRIIRRPASLQELMVLIDCNKDELYSAVNYFTSPHTKFLVAYDDKNDSIIDVSHESIFYGWDTLQMWLNEEAESVKILLRLNEAAELYKSGMKDILIGVELQHIMQWYTTVKPSRVWASRFIRHPEKAFEYLFISKANEHQRKVRLKTKTRITTLLILAFAFIAIIYVILYYSK